MQAENMPSVVFSSRLRSIMVEKGLTQTGLARSLGISQSAVSKWFNGSIPSGTALAGCACVLETTVEELLGKPSEKKRAILVDDSAPARRVGEKSPAWGVSAEQDLAVRLAKMEGRMGRMETQLATLLDLLGAAFGEAIKTKKAG